MDKKLMLSERVLLVARLPFRLLKGDPGKALRNETAKVFSCT